MHSEAPVLFFDSGLGGLSVLQPALALIPQMPVVYACDIAGLPYGEKSEAEVGTRVSALLGRLIERVRPRLAVIACNTASTIALGHVRAALDTPFVGTVPAIKPAALASNSRTIGVLGTEATVRQPYLDQLIADHAPDCRVLRHGAGALVGAAEAKLRGMGVEAAVLRDALLALRDQPGGEVIDSIVLACTHFPLLRPELDEIAQQIFGANVRFFDGSAGIARRIATLTAGQDWPVDAPYRRMIINGQAEQLGAAWQNFAALGFASVEQL